MTEPEDKMQPDTYGGVEARNSLLDQIMDTIEEYAHARGQYQRAGSADALRRLKEQLAALSPAPRMSGDTAPAGWEIDHSTDSPILTYEKCSVIQDEQAHYVMSLIRGAALVAPATVGVKARVEALLTERQKRAETLHDMLDEVREALRAKLRPDTPADERAIYGKLNDAVYVLRGDPFDMDIRSALTAGEPALPGGDDVALRVENERLRDGLRAAIRAANLALFVINKQGVMPNSSWESGFKSDLAKAEAALEKLAPKE